MPKPCPLQLAQGFSSFQDLSPPTRSVCPTRELACVLSLVVFVSHVCVCWGTGLSVVWASRPPDLTQGMPAVEGDDCRGQVGLREFPGV